LWWCDSGEIIVLQIQDQVSVLLSTVDRSRISLNERQST
jgi:hypothetical protein